MTLSKKTVSVVIPMYNSSGTIQTTLDSVKKQSYNDFEIIIVDDGSTDHCASLVEAYIIENPELKINLIKKSNGGVSTARNMGIKNSNGKYIAFLDSDDEWLPGKLERQIEILKQHPEIDFLGTTRNDEHFDKVLWKRFGLLTKIGPKLLLVKFIFVVPTIIFKSEMIDSIGYFDESQKYAEEGNYFIRICNQFNCYLLNESLVVTGGGKAHFGASGLSGNIKEMEKGELKNMKYAYGLGIINIVEYYLLVMFSLLKYLRRVLIVKIFR